jgi:hypothetical protein
MRRAHVTLALLLMGAMLLLWTWRHQRELDAIEQLAKPERRDLYERTLQTLTSSCGRGTRPSGLDEFCRQQAEFILQFSECDASCQSLSRQQRGTPAR